MGTKYKSVMRGVESELELCKRLGYSFTMIEFVQAGDIRTYFRKANPDDLHFHSIPFAGPEGSNTPLYDTIISKFESLLADKAAEDSLLIKIMTDGLNNVNNHLKSSVYKIIKLAEQNNCTVTFICAAADKYNILDIGIDDSNIQTHDNTAESVEHAFNVQMDSTIRYAERRSKGEDVTRGFYKTVND